MINLPTLSKMSQFYSVQHGLSSSSCNFDFNFHEFFRERKSSASIKNLRFLFFHPRYTNSFIKKQIMRKGKLNFSKVKNQLYPN